jgi:hypothetical protein
MKFWNTKGYISQTVKLGALGIPSYRSFSLVELEAATDNFENSYLIGQDSLGEVPRHFALVRSDSEPLLHLVYHLLFILV